MPRKPELGWCPGCGNFGILVAFRQALKELNLDPENVVAVSGIGCHGRIVDYLDTNTFHTIHGRVLPVAIGVKLANPNLTVVGFAGDGDAYSIGVGHLIHAARYNVPITYIVHNNNVFALTRGQPSPTSNEGFNPILLALASGATFVARGYARDVKKLKEIFIQALKHKGFAFIDVVQTCVIFGEELKEYYYLDAEGHDEKNLNKAIMKALDRDRVALGIFYKSEKPSLLRDYLELGKSLFPPPKVSLSKALNSYKVR